MPILTEDKRLIQHEIHSEMKTSYMDYAMSVIVGRALPDVRDGLKPVHRRILYGMGTMGVTPDKPYKKSARIVVLDDFRKFQQRRLVLPKQDAEDLGVIGDQELYHGDQDGGRAGHIEDRKSVV